MNALVLYHGDNAKEIQLSDNGSTNEYFRGTDCPDGKWGFVNKLASGIYGIVNTFDANQIDFCYVNMKPEEKRLNLEQWSKPKEGRVTVTNTYEFWK